MRFPLRAKFFLFATLAAVAPLALVAENLTRIARDELKSAANEQLTEVAGGIAEAIDQAFWGRWLAPLRLVRNAVDSPELGVREKIAVLTLGLSSIPDVVALQLTIGDSDLPVLVTDEVFSARLAEAGLDPVATLRTGVAEIAAARAGPSADPSVQRIEATGAWLATVVLPLDTEFSGQPVTLSARIELSPLASLIAEHPFTRRGEITVIDAAGRSVLEPEPRDLGGRAIVASAVELIGGDARVRALDAYARPDGAAMLGAYAFPGAFPWAVVTELAERDAYAVVGQMTRSVALLGALALGAAVAGAFVFADRLTRPILRIGEAARRVGQGDFATRVEGVRRADEIGDLAGRMNVMIGELGEREALTRFVSHGTLSAIQAAGLAPLALGGERRRVAVLFSDIRGYTGFTEAVAPEVVVEMLNVYLETQTAIVEAHGGDVDKFVGDEVVALFQGPEMERRATACAIAIQHAMSDLLQAHPDWDLHVGIGVSAGEVVLGAIGARERMDFTALGQTVNFAAHLCEAAPPGAVLVSAAIHEVLASDPTIALRPMDPLRLKGSLRPVPVFAASEAGPAAKAEPRASPEKAASQ